MQPKAAGFIFEGGEVTIPGATAGPDFGRPTGPAYAGWHMPGGQISEKIPETVATRQMARALPNAILTPND